MGGHSRTYVVWKNMRQRCNNPNNPAYKNYGERGIAVALDWNDYWRFLADMGEAPVGKLLERIDNNKGYTKDNCKWADRQEQNENKNRDGVLYGVHYCNTSKRWVARGNFEGNRTQLYKGWDFFEAACARKSWENQVCK